MVGETGTGLGPEDPRATVTFGPEQHRDLARAAEQHGDSAAAAENRAQAEAAEVAQPSVIVSPELRAQEAAVQTEGIPQAQAQAFEAAAAAEGNSVNPELLSKVNEIVHFDFGGPYEYTPNMSEDDRQSVLDNWSDIVAEVGAEQAQRFLDNMGHAAVDEDTFRPDEFSVLQTALDGRESKEGNLPIHDIGHIVDPNEKPKKGFFAKLKFWS